ncbi:MAG: MFS transporter [Paraglaciecola sp.]|nr:MFS transporter [Paraglaciecola sp.]MDP5032648.1 MFS transporter [Paraglaciecola sp.]
MSQRAFSNTNLFLLAFTYFCYFGHVGAIVPYLGVFLDSRGFSSVEIGQLSALITLTRIVGPHLWSSFTDSSGKNLRMLQLGCFLSLCCFSLVLWSESFWALSIAIGLMMMFVTAILPQIEVITLSCVKGQGNRYGRIRLWGSIGYILLTVATGAMIDRYSTEAPVYITLLILLTLFLSTFLLTEPQSSGKAKKLTQTVWPLLKTPTFIGFILSGILLQMSFGPYYSFFALYAKDLGYSGQATGWLIATGVMVEVGIFVIAGGLIKRFGAKRLLIISMLLTSVRWGLLAFFAEHLYWLLFSQMLHAFSFGMAHAASIYFIHHYFGKKFQSRGQAIYMSLAFGVGGAVGGYAAGEFWHQGSGAELTFLLASIAAFLAMICLLPINRKRMDGAL